MGLVNIKAPDVGVLHLKQEMNTCTITISKMVPSGRLHRKRPVYECAEEYTLTPSELIRLLDMHKINQAANQRRNAV